MAKYTKIDNAYNFLTTHSVFSLLELSAASGWTKYNTRTNISKKLKSFLDIDSSGKYKILPTFKKCTKDEFRKIFSQTYTPKNTTEVEKLLNKSKECMLTAVQNYNNPTLEYRLGSFITISFIGFAGLFHAIFERDRSVNYIKHNSDFLPLIDALDQYKGKKWYNLKYNKNYLKKEVKNNLEGLRRFRNNIEHSYCELLEIDLFPLCQKLLYDYQKILIMEFGQEHNIGSKLCLALQFSYQYDYSRIKQNKEYQAIKKRIIEHMISANCDFPAIVPIMIPADKYKTIDLTQIDQSKNAQIITIIQNQKRNNAKNTVAELNEFLEKELNFTAMKFDGVKLLKLSRVYGWRDNKQNILDETYLGYDDLRKNNIFYKNEAIDYIKKELKQDIAGVFHKVLSNSQFEKFFNNKN